MVEDVGMLPELFSEVFQLAFDGHAYGFLFILGDVLTADALLNTTSALWPSAVTLPVSNKLTSNTESN